MPLNVVRQLSAMNRALVCFPCTPTPRMALPTTAVSSGYPYAPHSDAPPPPPLLRATLKPSAMGSRPTVATALSPTSTKSLPATRAPFTAPLRKTALPPTRANVQPSTASAATPSANTAPPRWMLQSPGDGVSYGSKSVRAVCAKVRPDSDTPSAPAVTDTSVWSTGATRPPRSTSAAASAADACADDVDVVVALGRTYSTPAPRSSHHSPGASSASLTPSAKNGCVCTPPPRPVCQPPPAAPAANARLRDDALTLSSRNWYPPQYATWNMLTVLWLIPAGVQAAASKPETLYRHGSRLSPEQPPVALKRIPRGHDAFQKASWVSVNRRASPPACRKT